MCTSCNTQVDIKAHCDWCDQDIEITEELIQETEDKIKQILNKIKVAKDKRTTEKT